MTCAVCTGVGDETSLVSAMIGSELLIDDDDEQNKRCTLASTRYSFAMIGVTRYTDEIQSDARFLCNSCNNLCFTLIVGRNMVRVFAGR